MGSPNLLSAFSERAREDSPPDPSNDTIHPAGEPIATMRRCSRLRLGEILLLAGLSDALETIFGFSEENAEIADWLAERGGLEAPLSPKELSDGKRRGWWRFVKNEAGHTSCVKTIRSPSVSLADGGIGCFAHGVCGSAFSLHHLSVIRHITIAPPKVST